MSDRIKTATDVAWRPAGVGMTLVFICPRCGKRKESTGRRLQRVQGLRTWVCKGCVHAS